jgi:hypothetical protein
MAVGSTGTASPANRANTFENLTRYTNPVTPIGDA